jgi:predicted RNA binding protein YcfA (HicA-like mRNA interferase family)
VSAKLPPVKATDAVRVAQRIGFEFRRQRGSHAIYIRSADQARVVIPIHSKGELKPKTLRGIIHDMKLTVEDFRKLL